MQLLQPIREVTSQITARALCVLLFVACAGCMVVKRPGYLESKALSDPAPWRFSGSDRAEFFGEKHRVSISPHFLYHAAGSKPLAPSYVYVCVRGKNRSADLVELDATKVTLELEHAKYHPVDIQSWSDSEKSCWNLGFNVTPKVKEAPMVVSVRGLAIGGALISLSDVEFREIPDGIGVCAIPCIGRSF